MALFIAFFTVLMAVRAVLDVNDPTKTLPDILHALITRHAGNATLAAIGLLVMTVQPWKLSQFIGNRGRKQLAEPFTGGAFTGEPRTCAPSPRLAAFWVGEIYDAQRVTSPEHADYSYREPV